MSSPVPSKHRHRIFDPLCENVDVTIIDVEANLDYAVWFVVRRANSGWVGNSYISGSENALCRLHLLVTKRTSEYMMGKRVENSRMV